MKLFSLLSFLITLVSFSPVAISKPLKSMYGVPFDHEGCKWAYRTDADRVCPVLEGQYNSPYFRRDLVYISNIAVCDKITGNQTSNRNHPNAVFCVIYVTDSEPNRTIIIRTQFGSVPKYPLMYQNLMVNIKVVPRSVLMATLP